MYKLLVLVLLVGCGKQEIGVVNRKDEFCHTEYIDEGIKLMCGTETTIFPLLDVEIVDVCPDSAFYNESLMLVNGEYLAYYSGSTDYTRRLTKLLENVTYSTTDGRGRLFKIVGGEIVCL